VLKKILFKKVPVKKGWGIFCFDKVFLCIMTEVGSKYLQESKPANPDPYLEVRIRKWDASDTGTGTDLAGYPANLKAGYRISGRMSDESRIPDIWPDFQLNMQMTSQI
jgi:hypothetical protein